MRWLSLLALAASRLGAAASYPFPQNQAQPFFTQYPAYANADVTASYNRFKAQQVTATGAGGFRRVQRNGDPTLQPNSTVSEGIAYGMVMGVYMDDQALFDDLWRYHNLHLDGNGLMNWYISADGNTVLGGGAASDADQDIAWALIMAHYQWGSSAALPQPYQVYALDMVNKVWTHEVEKPSMVFKPGDGWGGAGTTNVSYFDPSMYRVFAQFSGNSGWLQVVDKCYEVLFNSLNAANGNQMNGLVPAWCDSNGVPVIAYAGAPTHYQYDSVRTPFRIMKDWAFFGEPRALSYAAKTNAFFSAIGAISIEDGYNLNGSSRAQYGCGGSTSICPPSPPCTPGSCGQSAVFVGAAASGAMTQAAYGAFVQAAYNRLITGTLLIGGPYYEQSWETMCLLMMSGNYLNYMPAPTPTPTPDACQNRIRVNAGGGGQDGFSADQAFSAGGWGYLAAYAGTVGTSSGPISGTTAPGLYLNERYANAGGEIRYDFTMPNGPVTVTLHWAETYYTANAQRRMDVYIEGALVEDNLDIHQAAPGHDVALVRSYNATVAGGLLSLRFAGVTGEATIHAIDVQGGPLCTPTRSPTLTPNVSPTASPTRTPSLTRSPSFTVSPTASPSATPFPTPDACALVRRVNAGGLAFSGAGGLNWAADQAYSAGSYGYVSFAAGTAGTSAGPIAGTTDDALFMAERWGNPVRYRFDLPNGAYQVRVRLAETYFNAPGGRSYSLSANGAVILNSVDLFTWCGGQNTARDHTFFSTVASGRLELESWSANNNGTFQAIEILGLDGCSPTATRTRTLTPFTSPTLTASPSPTRSQTHSPTSSPSSSGSPSPSQSASPSPTRSETLTPPPSPSPSASSTLSTTAAISPTPTPTSTLQPGSPTRTWTSQPTFSATPFSTRSHSPTAAATMTPMPSLSASPTLNPSPLPSSSPTTTPLATTPSPSSTPMPPLSEIPTPSESSTAWPSPSFSPTQSPSPAASGSPSPSPSALASGTETRTPGPASSASPSPWASESATQTPMATATASSTQTPSPTLSHSPASSATETPGSSPSPSPGISASESPSPAATPPPTSGPLKILSHLPCPNPNPEILAVEISGGPAELELRIYTPALALVEVLRLPGLQQGRVTLKLPGADKLSASGLYFYRLEARALGGAEKHAVTGRFLMLW